MGTACLFPGLNSIARDRDRARFLRLPEIAENIVRLRRRGHDRWLKLPALELYRSGDFTALAALTLAIQEGTYRHLLRRGLQPDILAGCSLGDVARTVCSGAIEFDDAIDLMEDFRRALGDARVPGTTCSVRLPANRQTDSTLLRVLGDQGLEPSVLSDRHFIVGCDPAGARALQRLAAAHGWKVRTAPFPYALHSRHLRPLTESLLANLSYSFRAPRVAVFSTVQLRRLDSATAVQDDACRCFHTPVQWVRALEQLRTEFGIERFINIGPCNSLPLLLRETSLEIAIEPPAAFMKIRTTEASHGFYETTGSVSRHDKLHNTAHA